MKTYYLFIVFLLSLIACDSGIQENTLVNQDTIAVYDSSLVDTTYATKAVLIQNDTFAFDLPEGFQIKDISEIQKPELFNQDSCFTNTLSKTEIMSLKKKLKLKDKIYGPEEEEGEDMVSYEYYGNCKSTKMDLFSVSLYEDYFYFLFKDTIKQKVEEFPYFHPNLKTFITTQSSAALAYEGIGAFYIYSEFGSDPIEIKVSEGYYVKKVLWTKTGEIFVEVIDIDEKLPLKAFVIMPQM